MGDEDKTREQLISELAEQRRQMREFHTHAQRREAQRSALYIVREEVWKMQDEEDIENVIMAVRSHLVKLGIPFQACGLNIISDASNPPAVRFHNMTREGYWSVEENEKASRIIAQFWRAGQSVYRRNLDEEDRYQERSTFVTPMRAVIDVPFSHGTLAVSSSEPEAFSQRDIELLQETVQVLSEGFTRLEDFHNLEQRNKALETEIHERQRVDEELREVREELEHRVDERTAELKAANQQLRSEIVERQQAEAALREGEERYRTLFEHSRDAITITSHDGQFIDFNQAALALWGYTREEMFEQDAREFYVHPGEGSRYRQEIERKGFVKDYEVKHFKKDGTEIDCLQTATVRRASDGRLLGYQGVIRDITQRKQAEQQLLAYQDQLRSLASTLVLAEERERRRIATDLHDGVGQTLAVAKIKLGALRASAASAELTASLDEVRALVDQTIQDTRSLSFELSPPVLYELGFEAAVEWLAEQFQKQHDMQIEIDCNGQFGHLQDELCVLLYRGVRELVINVVKHAQAGRAKVSARRLGDEMRIEVEDDGVGFDTSTLDSRKLATSGFGLFNLQERMAYIGGSLQVESESGRGTCALLVVPLKKN